MAGKRLLFGVIGMVATSIAVIGVWLPGVPTVFPLIIALWAFGKSSERLTQWLERLPLLRHAIAEARRFEQERSIDRRVKVLAVSSAWISTLVVALTTQSIVISAIVASVAFACSIFMANVPTRQSDELIEGE